MPEAPSTPEQANAALGSALALLKDPEATPRAVSDAIVSMNDALYGAIERFPTEANAVRVSLDAPLGLACEHAPTLTDTGQIYFQALDEATRGTRPLGPISNEDQERYRRATEKEAHTLPLSLVKHLPFTPRAAASSQTIEVQNCGFPVLVFPDRAFRPTVVISLNDSAGPFSVSREERLLPRDIRSLELALVDDVAYSPRFRQDHTGSYLHTAGSYLAHYCAYRGFQRGPDVKPPSPGWENHRKTASEITLGPEGLFSAGDYLNGFALHLPAGKPPVLYQFDELIYTAGSDRDMHRYGVAWGIQDWVMQMKPEGREWVIAHQGMDAVRLLAAIKTRRES